MMTPLAPLLSIGLITKGNPFSRTALTKSLYEFNFKNQGIGMSYSLNLFFISYLFVAKNAVSKLKPGKENFFAIFETTTGVSVPIAITASILCLLFSFCAAFSVLFS